MKDKDDVEIIEEELDESENSKVRDKFKKIRTELSECRKERNQNLDNLQRARADLMNVRRNAEKDRAEVSELIKRRLLSDLLEVVDNFERALPAGRHVSSMGDENKVWQGIEQIHNQFINFLKSHGAIQMNAHEKPFDPLFHESVGEVEVGDQNQDHMVREVVRMGYMIGDSVLRPAQVKIGKFINL